MAEGQAASAQTPPDADAAPTQSQAGQDARARILFVGDVVGGIGRRTLLECLPLLRERFQPTFVVVNAENIAGGLGITPKAADELLAAGVDAITLGNHTYHRREIYPYLDDQPRILRPANFLRSQPGHGTCVVEHDGVRLGVVNLSGNLYLRAGARRSRRSRPRWASSATSITCSSTCTPRRRRRRSRWAGTSTAA